MTVSQGDAAIASTKVQGWQDVAKRRRDEIRCGIPPGYHLPETLLNAQSSISLPEDSGILDQKELEITRLTATELLKLIHNETYTSVEVTTAFCKRAAVAHQATNCLAWVMFQEALAAAAALDGHMKIHHKPIGPLHGLPVSVKEFVNVRGTPATSGYIAWADNISDDDALIVKVFREAGAVFHVKTTVPQGLMAVETVSNLYGTTTNPYNSNLSPGGSSGGEGALVAMRGSLLGIATDIGGSIRVPAGFSGVYGLKGSAGRIPHGGLSGVQGGMENVVGVIGPIATCLEDLRLFYEVALRSEPWNVEPSLIELPWKPTAIIPPKLRIGVLYHDGVVAPHPPVSRCLKSTAEAIERAGHTLVPWDPALHADLVNCLNEFLVLDNGEEFLQEINEGAEPLTPLSKTLVDKIRPEPYSVRDTWKLNARRDDLQTAYAKQWNEAKIDAIICPVGPSVASAHGESPYWGYTSVYNVLDYSTLIFPVGIVEKTDTWENFPPKAKESMSGDDATYRGFYTGPEKYADAPVALQLVTRRFRDEQSILIGEEICRVLS